MRSERKRRIPRVEQPFEEEQRIDVQPRLAVVELNAAPVTGRDKPRERRKKGRKEPLLQGGRDRAIER